MTREQMIAEIEEMKANAKIQREKENKEFLEGFRKGVAEGKVFSNSGGVTYSDKEFGVCSSMFINIPRK